MGQALQPRAVCMILQVDAVDTFYGETQALFGASLAVERAKVFALLGPNGAGKTTMLRSILGLTRPKRGAIRFDGRDVTRSATHDIARAGIGWVPDDRRIFPALKVRANLALGKKRTPFRSWTEKNVYELFPALEYLLDRESENLSGGEMQMVGVMGPNGSGKTTLFEMLSGSNIPTSGKVICAGQDVHRVKYRERDRMVIHYHQSYQVRRMKKTVPSFMLG